MFINTIKSNIAIYLLGVFLHTFCTDVCRRPRVYTNTIKTSRSKMLSSGDMKRNKLRSQRNPIPYDIKNWYKYQQ